MRDALGWEWDEAPGVPSVTDAMAELVGAVEQIVADRLTELVTHVERELTHAHFNEQFLSDRCQGVGPGERVPAVRASFIRAALEGGVR